MRFRGCFISARSAMTEIRGEALRDQPSDASSPACFERTVFSGEPTEGLMPCLCALHRVVASGFIEGQVPRTL